MDPFIGEIRVFSFQQVPNGWLPCDGRTLNPQQNAALFALLGVQYGGNGTTTFNLPDFRGTAMIGQGVVNSVSYACGNKGGTEKVQLGITQIPGHSHTMTVANVPGTQGLNNGDDYLAGFTYPPSNNVNGYVSVATPNTPPPNPTTLIPASIASEGGNQGHENRQPYLTLNVCIATIGIWPSRD